MTSQPSRRFHEAGVGSRTGLRLSAVARDQDGFEDLEAFYKASEAALDHRQHQPEIQEEESYGDDYDSYDETHFSARPSSSGARGRDHAAAGSSSVMMDLQDSSAPSPRSVLRASRGSAAGGSSSSPYRKGRSNGNITLADDDDDLDLPNLSTGSRSFDLMTMGEDYDGEQDATLRAPPTPSIPERGLSARTKGAAASSKAKGKGKSQATTHRLELSDSEDDDILASIQQRLESAYDDEDDQGMSLLDDDEISLVRPPPLKATTTTSVSKPRSPKRPTAAQKRAEAKQTIPTQAAPPPKKRKQAPQSKPRAFEQEPESAYGYDDDDGELDYLPYRSPSPAAPAAAPPPKKKRGRPPKSASVEPPTHHAPAAPRTTQKSKSTSNGAARQTTSSSKLKTTKSKKAAGEVVERVRSRSGEATVIDENGVRRSTRQRFAPLEYWRGERIRYGRPSLPTGTTPADLRGSQHAGEDEFEDDPSMMFTRKRVPVLDVKEVIRIPRAPGEGTFSGTTRVRTTSRSKVDRKSEERTPRLDSLTPDPAQTPDPLDDWSGLDPTADTIQVEDGWDSKTRRTGVVIDEDEGKEMEMDVVRTKASLRPVAAANQQFRFEKLFNCGGLMATGVLYLPPESRKPTKPSQDNNFVFCVLQGAIRATVHRKSFIVGPHGIFQVPSGNTYALENICSRDVHLFFAQCRKTKKANAGDLTTFTQMSDTSHTPRALLRGLGVEYVDRDERELSEQEPYYDEAQESEGYDSREGDYAQPHNKRSKSTSARAPAQAQMYSTDSDAEFSDEDDFELSQVKTKKKRKFRKI